MGAANDMIRYLIDMVGIWNDMVGVSNAMVGVLLAFASSIVFLGWEKCL